MDRRLSDSWAVVSDLDLVSAEESAGSRWDSASRFIRGITPVAGTLTT
jgi:hypothetical protein